MKAYEIAAIGLVALFLASLLWLFALELYNRAPHHHGRRLQGSKMERKQRRQR